MSSTTGTAPDELESRRRSSQPFGGCTREIECDRGHGFNEASMRSVERLATNESVAEEVAESDAEEDDEDPVIPAWPSKGDPLTSRRFSNRPQDQVQHKVYSLKDYSQVAGPSLANQPHHQAPSHPHPHQASGKQLVKSLSQDRKMGKGGKAKRMSECGLATPAPGLPHSANMEPHPSQPLVAAESRIDRMRKLFVSPLSRQASQLHKSHGVGHLVPSSANAIYHPATNSSNTGRRQANSGQVKAGAKGFRVYGCPLQMANNIYPITCFGRPDIYKQQSVPYVLARLCNYIEENSSHLTHEGIFRVSGNARLMEKLRTLFDHLGDAPLESESVDVATSASMLKMYLRELPEPLIPTRMNYYFITLAKKYSPYLAKTAADGQHQSKQFQQRSPARLQQVPASSSPSTSTSSGHLTRTSSGTAASSTSSLAGPNSTGTGGSSSTTASERAQQERQRLAFSRDLTKLVRKLPIDNYNLLKYLACFLYRISLKQQYNKMCAEALGIVFGPNVFRIRSESYKGLKEQELSNQIMASIISNYKSIFDCDLTDPLGNLIEEVYTSAGEEPAEVVAAAVATSVALLVSGADELIPVSPPSTAPTSPLPLEEEHSKAPAFEISSGSKQLPEEPVACCSKQQGEKEDGDGEDGEMDSDEDEDCQDESYTPSSNSGSYCSSIDTESLESSYDDDDDDDGDDDDDEGGNANEDRENSSSSDCQSDTSYTPTSSHTEVSIGGFEEHNSCRACARRASQVAFASAPIGTSNDNASKHNNRAPTCDGDDDDESGKAKSDTKDKEAATSSTTKTSVDRNLHNSRRRHNHNHHYHHHHHQQHHLHHEMEAFSRRGKANRLGLIGRRSSSTSSLGRINQQHTAHSIAQSSSSPRKSSREHQQRRQQQTESQHRRASNRLRRQRARSHTLGTNSTTQNAAQKQLARAHNLRPSSCNSSSASEGKSYLASAEVSTVALDKQGDLLHTDSPATSETTFAGGRYFLPPDEHYYLLRSFNSDETLLRSVSFCAELAARQFNQQGNGALTAANQQARQACRRFSGLDLGAGGGSVLRPELAAATKVHHEQIYDEQAEASQKMMDKSREQLGSFVSLTGSDGCAAGQNNVQSKRVEEKKNSKAASMEEQDHNKVISKEPILEQMRATKELCRQLKRLLRLFEDELLCRKQLKLLVGQMWATVEDQNHANENNTWLTCYTDHVTATELAKKINLQLELIQDKDKEKTLPFQEEHTDEESQLQQFLVDKILMLKRRHTDLKRLRDHSLRCHLAANSTRQFSSTTSLLTSGDGQPPQTLELSNSQLVTEDEEEEETRAEEEEESCRFGPLCPAKFVFQIERQLASKRHRAGRNQVPLGEMSQEQLAGEKLELQKNLLRYEHWFGRPDGRLDSSLVGHIYQRYRAVKLLLRRSTCCQQSNEKPIK